MITTVRNLVQIPELPSACSEYFEWLSLAAIAFMKHAHATTGPEVLVMNVDLWKVFDESYGSRMKPPTCNFHCGSSHILALPVIETMMQLRKHSAWCLSGLYYSRTSAPCVGMDPLSLDPWRRGDNTIIRPIWPSRPRYKYKRFVSVILHKPGRKQYQLQVRSHSLRWPFGLEALLVLSRHSGRERCHRHHRVELYIWRSEESDVRCAYRLQERDAQTGLKRPKRPTPLQTSLFLVDQWSIGTLRLQINPFLRKTLSNLKIERTAWTYVIPIFQSILNNSPSLQLGNVCPITAFIRRNPSTAIKKFIFTAI